MNYNDYNDFENLQGGATSTTVVGEASENSDDEYNQAINPNPSGNDEDDFANVEIVEDQIPTQDISVPLSAAAGRDDRMLDASRCLQGVKAPLLITDRIQEERFNIFFKVIDGIPTRKRNIAVIGHIHHGKTSFSQLLLSGYSNIIEDKEPHPRRPPHVRSSKRKKNNGGKSTDKIRGGCDGDSDEGEIDQKDMLLHEAIPLTHPLPQEVDRKISIRTASHTAMVSGAKNEATQLFTVLDTPGHANFVMDTHAALRMADVAFLCVDAAEHFTDYTGQLVRQAVLHEELPLVLCITKIDRLILDLHLPPQEAHNKIKYLIDSVNNVIQSCGGGGKKGDQYNSSSLVTPVNGTVCFSSAKLGLFFTVEMFARKYCQLFSTPRNCSIDPAILATRLWGPVVYDTATKKFIKLTNPLRQRNTFVKFIMEPLYKVIAHSITGKGYHTLSGDLMEFPEGPSAAVREAVTLYFGCFQKEAVDGILNATTNNCVMMRNKAILGKYDCLDMPDPHVVLVATLMVPGPGMDLLAYCRVVQGQVKKGTELYCVGEFDVHAKRASVENVYLKMGAGFVEVESALPGSLVAVKGLAERMEAHHCMFVSFDDDLDDRLVPALYGPKPMMQVAIENTTHQHIMKLKNGVQRISMLYPGFQLELETTGGFTLSGHGEMQFEAAMHDLRSIYCTGFPVNLAAPHVTFAETISRPEGVLATYPPNGSGSRNRIEIVASQVPANLSYAIENQLLPDEEVQLYTVLKKDYGWDSFSARSGRLLAVGPDCTKGTNILVDDSIDGRWGLTLDEVLKGFTTATINGPLCASEVRGTRFDIISRASSAIDRIAARDCIHLSLLGASPVLLEPVLSVDITAPAKHYDTLRKIIMAHRGNIIGEYPCPASPLAVYKAQVPIIDSFGLETKIRMSTGGEAFPVQGFDHWDVVPGDPFDIRAEVTGGPLEPARGHQLARDFVIKTRNRKGMASDPEQMMGQ